MRKILIYLALATSTMCCDDINYALIHYGEAKENMNVHKQAFKTSNQNIDGYLKSIKDYKRECLHLLYQHNEEYSSEIRERLEDKYIQAINIERKIKQLKKQ